MPSGARSTLPWRWGGGGGFAERWVVCQRSGSARRGRRARPRRRREAGSRAHACFPTQERCGTHSPHGRHGRGTDHRNTRTHWHEACRPGKHKIMSHVRRLLGSVVWEADAGREHSYTERTVTQAEAPRLRRWDEGSQARQTAGCPRLSGSKAALWAQGRHTPHAILHQSLPGTGSKGKIRASSQQGQALGPFLSPTAPPRQVLSQGTATPRRSRSFNPELTRTRRTASATPVSSSRTEPSRSKEQSTLTSLLHKDARTDEQRREAV